MLEMFEFKDIKTGSMLIRPCIEIMMFSDVSVKEAASNYLLTYRALQPLFGKQLRFYKTNDMKRAKELTCNSEEQIRIIIEDTKIASSTFFVIQQHSGYKEDDYGLPSFTLFSEREKINPKIFKDHVLYRICIDLNQINNVPKVLTNALQYFPLSSGYCSYSYYYNIGNLECIDYIEQHNAKWLKRFPGLSHGNPLQFLLVGNDGLLQVGWLTMLGEKFTCNPEEIANLIESLPKEVERIDVPGTTRLILKAGSAPELGDRNRQNDLPLYKGVGKALANIRLPDSILNEISIDGLEDEDVRDWLLRFFGDETD